MPPFRPEHVAADDEDTTRGTHDVAGQSGGPNGSADVASLGGGRGVLRGAEQQAGGVAHRVPAAAWVDVLGAPDEESGDLGRQVVRPEVEVGAHRAVRLVEPLEQQLHR